MAEEVRLSSTQLTENGYTPEFEAAILADAEELHAAVDNGTAKLYDNVAELFADLEAEDDEDAPPCHPEPKRRIFEARDCL